jgi:hypothetical protein
MEVARSARCSSRTSSPRHTLIGTFTISEFELTHGKHAIKRFSNRYKNGFSGNSASARTPALASPRSYPFAQLYDPLRSRSTRVLTLEIALGGLGERIRAV